MSSRECRSKVLGVLLALALCGACGYRVVGTGGELPGGITRVEVPVFENRTARTDVGRLLTEEFINRLLASSRLRVVPGEEAQAIISGTVTNYQRDPITFDSRKKPLENRLTIAMDLRLEGKEDKRLLFSERGVTVHYDFPVRSDLQENDRLENDAALNASRLMSQKLVGLMLQGF